MRSHGGCLGYGSQSNVIGYVQEPYMAFALLQPCETSRTRVSAHRQHTQSASVFIGEEGTSRGVPNVASHRNRSSVVRTTPLYGQARMRSVWLCGMASHESRRPPHRWRVSGPAWMRLDQRGSGQSLHFFATSQQVWAPGKEPSRGAPCLGAYLSHERSTCALLKHTI